MQEEKILNRLAVLKDEFEAGQKRLKQLESEQVFLRETLLRISGAIQVLQEVVDEARSGRPADDITIAAPAELRDPDGLPAS